MITLLLIVLLIVLGAIVVLRGAQQMLASKTNMTAVYAHGLRVAAGLGLVGIGQVWRLLLQINAKL